MPVCVPSVIAEPTGMTSAADFATMTRETLLSATVGLTCSTCPVQPANTFCEFFVAYLSRNIALTYQSSAAVFSEYPVDAVLHSEMPPSWLTVRVLTAAPLTVRGLPSASTDSAYFANSM